MGVRHRLPGTKACARMVLAAAAVRIGHEDATRRQPFLAIAEAEGETEVQPDSVADDLGGANLSTTQIYTHVDEDRMVSIVSKL